MGFPPFVAGQVLTAGQLRLMQWDHVEQGAPQSVNNSTTLVDTNISVTLEAGATYYYILLVSYTSNETADIAFTWSTPANSSVQRFVDGYDSGGNGASFGFSRGRRSRNSASTVVDVGGTSTIAAPAAYSEHGRILGGDGGVFTLQFAQDTADGTDDTTIDAVSRIDYVRIG